MRFWFGEGADYGKPQKRWFDKDPAFDAQVKKRFARLHDELARNRAWLDGARDCLARIIVLDQFPRHIHRGTAGAFASDAAALRATSSIRAGTATCCRSSASSPTCRSSTASRSRTRSAAARFTKR